MKLKIIGNICFVMMMASLIGIIFYNNTENILLINCLWGLFLVSSVLLSFVRLKQKSNKLKSGKIKAAVADYRLYEASDLFMAILGVAILAFSVYESIKESEIQLKGISIGAIVLIALISNVKRYFVMIDGNDLRIKGTHFEVDNISEIIFTEKGIKVYAKDTWKEFRMQKLTEQDKKEVYELLITSQFGDKVHLPE